MIFWVLLSVSLDSSLALKPPVGSPMSSSRPATLRFILVGVALMLLVIFRPQGIFGNKKEMAFVK